MKQKVHNTSFNMIEVYTTSRQKKDKNKGPLHFISIR